MTGHPLPGTDKDPAWLVAGATVLIERDRNFTQDRVAKLTQRDVVLEGGGRFNRARLDYRGGGTWAPTSYLRDPADPAVRERYRAYLVQRIRALTDHKVSGLLTEWRKSGNDTLAHNAVAALADALAKITALTEGTTEK